MSLDAIEQLRRVTERAHAVCDESYLQRQRDPLTYVDAEDWQGAPDTPLASDAGDIGFADELGIIDVGDWQDQPVPERNWIVPGWILSNAVTLISGAGGSGKSLLIQQWLAAIALGDKFLDTRAARPVPTLYVNCEDDGDELHRRQSAIAGAFNRHLLAYSGRMSIAVRLGRDNPLGTIGDDGKFKPSDLYTSIRMAARQIGAKVIALDNAMQMFVGNLNDPQQVTAFCNALSRLALDIDGAVILAGHVAKSEGSEFSGTMAWENAVRTRLYLRREKDDEGGENLASDVRVLSRNKGNYSRCGESLRMVWHAGAFYPDAPENAGQDFAEERAESAFLRCLDAATEQRRNASHMPSANYAPKVFAAMQQAAGTKRRDLEKAMQRLFDRGEIVANSYLWHDEKSRPKSGIKRAANVPNPCPEPVPNTGPERPEPLPQTVPQTPPYTTYNGAGPDGPPPLTEYGAAV